MGLGFVTKPELVTLVKSLVLNSVTGYCVPVVSDFLTLALASSVSVLVVLPIAGNI